MLKINFSYTDEFGNETTLSKTFTTDVFMDGDYSSFELLVDEFKNFLLAEGHSRENVDKIQIVED